ncbi:hypothetical protein BGZ70_002897 [Mortierella alpina]|uniref:Uncharacterized protein n=1 Tax=Mortierella alpina TaxID=64518 RepID=A0A9P6JE98_MORAP|nr:hypothetical protein BGZ70_002897 [Mortierella alpina]
MIRGTTNMNIKTLLFSVALASVVAAANRCETKDCTKENVAKHCCRGAGRRYSSQLDTCSVRYGYGRDFDECCESRGGSVKTLTGYYDCWH